MPTYRLTELRVHNFKRIVAALVRPQGAVTEITGKNGAGKSTALDSIAAVLGGKELCPDDPIRHGQKEAEVSIDLVDRDDIISDLALKITRRWWITRNGDIATDLRVTAADGSKVSQPQQVADALYGRLAFDPLAFERLKPKEMFEQLKGLAGLDFTELDAEYRSKYDLRRDVNRDLKQADARLRGMIRPTDVPDSPPDQAQIRAEHDAAIRERDRQCSMTRELARNIETREDIAAQIKTIEARLVAMDGEIDGLQSQVNTFVDPNPDQYIEAMTKAGEVSELIAKAKAYDEAEREYIRLKEQSEELDNDLDSIKRQRSDTIQAATFPVDGLLIDGENECVLLNGVPFEQGSSAERLRTSIAIGLAMHGELKLMLVREGSLLDSSSRAILQEMAEAADAQVFLEVVTDGEPVGIVFEEGEIVAK